MVAHGPLVKGMISSIELTFMALNPNLKIVAPWKDPKWDLHSREDCLAYADQQVFRLFNQKRIYRKIETF